MSYTKSECVEALKEINLKVDGNLTSTAYREKKSDHHPSARTIGNKFGGSWNDAKSELGLETVETTAHKNITKGDCIQHLREVSEKVEGVMSNTDYQENKLDYHADESMIRYRLGSWNESKQKAGLDTLEEKEFTTEYNPTTLPVNEDYFSELNQESAYWLGFLYADGYVNSNRSTFELGLAAKDESHLRKFRQAVDAEQPIQRKTTNLNTEAVRITISREGFIEHLVELGLDIGKTESDHIPEMKVSLLPHFVRGLFDGDGTVREKKTIRISGYLPRFENLLDRLAVKGNLYEKKDASDGYGRVGFFGNDAERLANWMYPQGEETEPKLDRKYPSWA